VGLTQPKEDKMDTKKGQQAFDRFKDEIDEYLNYDREILEMSVIELSELRRAAKKLMERRVSDSVKAAIAKSMLEDLINLDIEQACNDVYDKAVDR